MSSESSRPDKGIWTFIGTVKWTIAGLVLGIPLYVASRWQGFLFDVTCDPGGGMWTIFVFPWALWLFRFVVTLPGDLWLNSRIPVDAVALLELPVYGFVLDAFACYRKMGYGLALVLVAHGTATTLLMR